MSSANSLSTSAQPKRRFHARRRMEGLIYVDLGPDNGAILIDLGEGGLGFQSVVPVSLDQAVLLKFKVPGEADPVESYAEVAWLNESGKGGGLRFVELSDNARTQIRGWAGELEAPEPGPLHAANGAAATQVAPESTNEESFDATEASAAAEAAIPEDTPAEISESLGEAGSAQPPSPPAPGPGANAAIHGPVPHSVRAADATGQVGQGAAPVPSPIPEFAVEIAAGTDASELLATTSQSPLPVAFFSATDAVDTGASGAPLAAGQKRGAGDAVEVPPENSAAKVSARPQSAVASEISRKAAAFARTPEAVPEIPQPSTATPAKPARPQSWEAKNLAQTSKRQRKPSSSKPEASLSSAYRQDLGARGAFGRQAPKPVAASTEWENLQDAEEDEFDEQPTLRTQALKIGIGAGVGVFLVLVLVFSVPFLKTLVQTTANARSASTNLANAPAFQVEVADLNNRRWILRSGGDAGSPFGETPSRRETPPSNAARKESAKSPRPDELNDSAETVTPPPQPKLANPKELALARPVAKPADAPAAQLLAPSIFDGITPPIGSLTDRLPTSGPDMPGIVSPAGSVSNRAATLQSAVLLQRVAPTYPINALQARIQGEVSVNATIGKDGIPKDLKLIRGDQRLVDAAFTAIRQWRYRPATIGGVPIETQTVVTVSFELK
jgi:TonB family protein